MTKAKARQLQVLSDRSSRTQRRTELLVRACAISLLLQGLTRKTSCVSGQNDNKTAHPEDNHDALRGDLWWAQWTPMRTSALPTAATAGLLFGRYAVFVARTVKKQFLASAGAWGQSDTTRGQL